MTVEIKKNHLSKYQLVIWCIALAFCIVSVVYAFILGQTDDILLAIVTPILISLPLILGKLLHFEINNVIFTCLEVYALGPLLGALYRLYYFTPWWDDVLHFIGGVVFAMFGCFIIDILNKGKNTKWCSILFAVCFSVFISVLWEFFEFGADRIFGSDMQNDTVVNSIISYELGNTVGEVGSISSIKDTSINGVSLGINGYLDIGLLDTMKDMIFEAIGAVIFGVYALIDNGKHPIFKKMFEEK